MSARIAIEAMRAVPTMRRDAAAAVARAAREASPAHNEALPDR
jgi:hypothetical protein